MASYCLDASVVLAWLFEQNIEAVERFFTTVRATDELSAAALLFPECVSNVREAEFRKEISSATAQGMVREFLGLNVRPLQSIAISERAFHLARRFQMRKAYDTHYLAAADFSGAELITRDRGLRHAATQVGVPVRFLA